MFAYLGLASEPAQVLSISANLVTLKSDCFYAPGLWMIVEQDFQMRCLFAGRPRSTA